jgi:DNA-directed RNA polymerase subunit omega
VAVEEMEPMIIPSADRLEERVGSKYALVILSAKRARQLKEGLPPLARTSSGNPLTVALEEVADGKIVALPPVEEDGAPVLIDSDQG